MGEEEKPAHVEIVDRLRASTLRAPRVALTMKDFELEKVLGNGSFAQVIQVKMKKNGKSYALKVMDKRHILREQKALYVVRERRVLNALKHEGILNLNFTFQDDFSLFLGTELCPGGELYSQIQERGKLPIDSVRFYATQVVLVLEHLHKFGVVHRDLKPENLLLTKEGHLKLADFGSLRLLQELEDVEAKKAYEPQRAFQEEKKTSFVGTAEYAAPEVLSAGLASPAMDYWSLGCVMYQMIVGKPPFKGGSQYLTFELVQKVDYTMPTEAEGMPEDAADLIGKLLVEDPRERLGSGPGGIADIKNHAFFRQARWEQAFTSEAPEYLEIEDEEGSDGEGGLDDLGSLAKELLIEPAEPPRSAEGAPAASEQSPSREEAGPAAAEGDPSPGYFDSLLGEDELIIQLGHVKKYKRLIFRRRILVLTNKRRLMYVDPNSMQLKGLILLDDEVECTLKSATRFLVVANKKTYVFEAESKNATLWHTNIVKECVGEG